MLAPVFALNGRAQTQKSLITERFTGRYHCGGAWRDFDFFASPVMGLLGVINAYLQMQFNTRNYIGLPVTFLHHDIVSVIAFGLLAYALYYFARKPMAK